MDFHSLARRELQALCKKNRIPANMTNVAMADALGDLSSVEGIEEIQEALSFLSPKKGEARSPPAPRTSRRTSARKPIASVEPQKEQQASPLPRARRVTAKTSEIMRMVSEGEEKEAEEKKEGQEEIMPDTPAVLADSKLQGMAMRNTRTRATKKEEVEGEDGVVEVTNTPATRKGRRMTSRRGAATPVPVEEVKDDVEVPSRTTRRTRQSSKAMATDAAATVATRRSTRGKAAAAISKMVPLSQQEEEQQEKSIETKEVQDILDGPFLNSNDKPSDLGETDCSMLCTRNSEEKVAIHVKEDEVIQPMTQGVHEEQPLEDEYNNIEGLKNLPKSPVAGDVKEDELIQEMEGYHEEQVPEVEGGHNQAGDALSVLEQSPTKELKNLPKSSVAGDVKEDEVIQEVDGCHEEQVPEVEGGHNQAGDALSGPEESPIRGLIAASEDSLTHGNAAEEQSKQDEVESLDLIPSDNILEETKEGSTHLTGDQAAEEISAISIGLSNETSPALGNACGSDDSTGIQVDAIASSNNIIVKAAESGVNPQADLETSMDSEKVVEDEDAITSPFQQIPSPAPSLQSNPAESPVEVFSDEFPDEMSDEFRNLIGELEKFKISAIKRSPNAGNLTFASSNAELKVGDEALAKNLTEAMETMVNMEAISDSQYIDKIAASFPSQKIDSPISKLHGLSCTSPAKISEEVVSVIGDDKESLNLEAKSLAEVGNVNERPDYDVNKENNILAGLDNISGVQQVEAKREAEGGKQNQQEKIDLDILSLRKLKFLYKEKISEVNNKVETRRLALAELSDNHS